MQKLENLFAIPLTKGNVIDKVYRNNWYILLS